MQRALTSGGRVMVWGESSLLAMPDGRVDRHEDLWDRGPEGSRTGITLFKQRRANMWMAVLNPRLSSYHDALASMLDGLYSADTVALDMGFECWGMKQTEWSERTLDFLCHAWPGDKCRVVFLCRDFWNVYQSAFPPSYRSKYGSRETDILRMVWQWYTHAHAAMEYVGKINLSFRLEKYEDLILLPPLVEAACEWAGCGKPDPAQYQTLISASGHAGLSFLEQDRNVLVRCLTIINRGAELLGYPIRSEQWVEAKVWGGAVASGALVDQQEGGSAVPVSTGTGELLTASPDLSGNGGVCEGSGSEKKEGCA
jgi:hypothetical protein